MSFLKKTWVVLKEATVGPFLTFFRVGGKTLSGGGRIVKQEAALTWRGFKTLLGMFGSAYREGCRIDKSNWLQEEYCQEYRCSQDLPFVKYKSQLAWTHLTLWLLTVWMFVSACLFAYQGRWGDMFSFFMYAAGTGALNILAISYFMVMNKYQAVLPYPVFMSRLIRLDTAIFFPKFGD